MATATDALRHIDEHPAVVAARREYEPRVAELDALNREDAELWRVVNPSPAPNERVERTAHAVALAQHRQGEIHIARLQLRTEVDAAERALAEACEVARADNLDAYAAIDAPLCSALDKALAVVLRIVEERQRLAESVTPLNRGRQVDAGPIVLTAELVEYWRDWRRAARRP